MVEAFLSGRSLTALCRSQPALGGREGQPTNRTTESWRSALITPVPRPQKRRPAAGQCGMAFRCRPGPVHRRDAIRSFWHAVFRLVSRGPIG